MRVDGGARDGAAAGAGDAAEAGAALLLRPSTRDQCAR